MQLQEPMISWLILVARLCLSSVYLVSGVHKLMYYRNAQAEFSAAGVPLTGLFLPATICLHLLASLGLLSGVFARESALALALFTLVATIQVHCFWRMQGAMRLERSRIALGNLAIIGGLLMLAAAGPGRLVL